MDEINERNATSSTDDRREEIKQKLRQFMYWNIYSVSIAIQMMRRLFKRDWIT